MTNGNETSVILGTMTKEQLKEMPLDRVKELLQNEWNYCKKHNEIRIEYLGFNEDQHQYAVNILKAYLLSQATMQLSIINPDTPYIAKANWSILETLEEEDEVKFSHFLKVLYLNGYLQKTYAFNVDEFDLNTDFHESFYQPPTEFIPHEHNLKWIYNNYPQLFSCNVLCSDDDKLEIENDCHFFKEKDTPEEIFKKMILYGTVVEIICSVGSVLSLSHRGMYILHIDQFNKNLELIEEQKELINKIGSTESKLMTVQKAMQKEFSNHRTKIRAFYKDIATVLSILVAAFSVIGVNISAIPKIENNFGANVLVINLSLIMVLVTLFYLLKTLVFKLPGEKYEGEWKWLGVYVAVAIILIVILFFGGIFPSYGPPRTKV